MTDIRLRQELAQIVKGEASITGFSYPLLRLLTDRLDELLLHDQLFEEGNANADFPGNVGFTLTRVGTLVVGSLSEVAGIEVPSSYPNIKKFIEDMNMFLSTFEL